MSAFCVPNKALGVLILILNGLLVVQQRVRVHLVVYSAAAAAGARAERLLVCHLIGGPPVFNGRVPQPSQLTNLQSFPHCLHLLLQYWKNKTW